MKIILLFLMFLLFLGVAGFFGQHEKQKEDISSNSKSFLMSNAKIISLDGTGYRVPINWSIKDLKQTQTYAKEKVNGL